MNNGGSVGGDDELLDRVGNDQPGPGEVDQVLTDWRRGLHRDPDPVLVDVDTAQAVIQAARVREATVTARLEWLGRWITRTLAEQHRRRQG